MLRGKRAYHPRTSLNRQSHQRYLVQASIIIISVSCKISEKQLYLPLLEPFWQSWWSGVNAVGHVLDSAGGALNFRLPTEIAFLELP